MLSGAAAASKMSMKASGGSAGRRFSEEEKSEERQPYEEGKKGESKCFGLGSYSSRGTSGVPLYSGNEVDESPTGTPTGAQIKSWTDLGGRPRLRGPGNGPNSNTLPKSQRWMDSDETTWIEGVDRYERERLNESERWVKEKLGKGAEEMRKIGRNQARDKKMNATSMFYDGIPTDLSGFITEKSLPFEDDEEEKEEEENDEEVEKDKEEAGTILCAARDGDFAKVKSFLGSLEGFGCNLGQKDREGLSVLHWACIHNDLEMTKYFLNKGVNREAKDKTKSTPLHVAAKNGHLAIVKALLRHEGPGSLKKPKKQLKRKDVEEMTPLDWAKTEGHDEVVKFIKSIKS